MYTRCSGATALLATLVFPGSCGRVGYDVAVPGPDAAVMDADLDSPAPDLVNGDIPFDAVADGPTDGALSDGPSPDLATEDGAARDASFEEGSAPVDASPRVSPRFRCGASLGDDEYVAVWGAINAQPYEVHVPIGPDNNFSPAPWDRGQVTRFPPGNTEYLFVTRWRAGSLVWLLTGRTSTTNIASAPCTLSPDMREIVLPSGTRVVIPPPP